MTTTKLWKTTTLYVHHTFWYFSWQSCANKQPENSSWERVVKETWADVTRDNSQRQCSAQYIVTTLLRYCFEWLQHCFNIETMCCAKNRRCESSRVTSPLWYGKEPVKGVKKTQTTTTLLQNQLQSNVRIARFTTHVQTCFVTNQVVAWCVNTDFCLDKIALELRHLGSYVTFGPVTRTTSTNMYRTTVFTLL